MRWVNNRMREKSIEKNSKVFKTQMKGTLNNIDWYLVRKSSMILRICNALVELSKYKV